jgi:hypothetical protein
MEKGPVGGGRGPARGLICMYVSSVFHGMLENDSVSGRKGSGRGEEGGFREVERGTKPFQNGKERRGCVCAFFSKMFQVVCTAIRANNSLILLCGLASLTEHKDTRRNIDNKEELR